MFIDSHHRVQLVHATTREFLTRKNKNSDFTISKAEAHERLAIICFQFVTQKQETGTSRNRRTSESDIHLGSTRLSPFRDYASNFVFQHLSLAYSRNEDLLPALAKFLNSTMTGPQEIEYQATRGLILTSIFCAKMSPLVFCGKEDGPVHVYDISGEPRSQELSIQSSNSSIRLLYFEESANVLGSSNMSGRVKAWK